MNITGIAIVLVPIFIFLLLLAVVYRHYSQIGRLYLLVIEQQTILLARLQRRNDMIMTILETAGDCDHTSTVLKWRRQSVLAATVSQQNQALPTLNKALQLLRECVAQNPSQHQSLSGSFAELLRIDEQLIVSAEEYNLLVAAYNSRAGSLPGRLICSILGMTQEERFSERAFISAPVIRFSQG